MKEKKIGRLNGGKADTRGMRDRIQDNKRGEETRLIR